MSTIIQEEWRILNALLKGVVDGKLKHRQQGIPVILSRVDKTSSILQGLLGRFESVPEKPPSKNS